MSNRAQESLTEELSDAAKEQIKKTVAVGIAGIAEQCEREGSPIPPGAQLALANVMSFVLTMHAMSLRFVLEQSRETREVVNAYTDALAHIYKVLGAEFGVEPPK
jgi:hypothetical protein